MFLGLASLTLELEIKVVVYIALVDKQTRVNATEVRGNTSCFAKYHTKSASAGDSRVDTGKRSRDTGIDRHT